MKHTSLFQFKNIIYPDHMADKYHPLWSYRSKFLLRGLLYRSAFNKIKNEIEPELLNTLCHRYQRFLEKPFRPYITNHNHSQTRAEWVVQHYQFISQHLPSDVVNKIYQDDNGLELIHFMVDEERYSLNLAYHDRYQKEGDLCLVLFDQHQKNFYTVTFIVRDNKGRRELIIGGLQGPESNDESNHKIKRLTKVLHGQRPKDLMIKILMIIAKTWKVDEILAIKTHSHTYCAKRYSKGRVKANYDQHWEALGGTHFDNDFYSLPIEDVRRNPEDISRPKRAMYQRRYEWLDDVTATLETTLKLK